MTMGQESSKNGDEAILTKYYPQLKPRREPFAEHYTLINVVLGEGITGKVYKCHRKNDPTSPIFALKALPKNGKTVREVVLHKRMQNGCKYIVQIHDVFENNVKGRDVLFIVMELMEGGELFTAISNRYPKKPFSEREVAQLVLCVCTAVKHLHDNGIAHRDLKPENLLFSSTDPDTAVIKLTDFGFAKESVDSLKTPNFTPYYGAPEVLAKVGFSSNGGKVVCVFDKEGQQLHHQQCYSLKCDMWALGVIIYILLSGYPPFYNSQGRNTLTPQMKNNISQANFRFPPEHGWQFVSEAPKKLISQLLVVNPNERLCINEVMENQWLKNCNQVSNSLLNSAGHKQLAGLNWGEILSIIAHPPTDVFRTKQRIILQPAILNPLFLKRQLGDRRVLPVNSHSSMSTSGNVIRKLCDVKPPTLSHIPEEEKSATTTDDAIQRT